MMAYLDRQEAMEEAARGKPRRVAKSQAKRRDKPREDDEPKGPGKRIAPYNGFVDHHLAKCSGTAVKVFFYLHRHANSDNVLKVSHNYVGNALGASRSTVIRAFRELEEVGAIRVLKRGSMGSKEPNSYFIQGVCK